MLIQFWRCLISIGFHFMYERTLPVKMPSPNPYFSASLIGEGPIHNPHSSLISSLFRNGQIPPSQPLSSWVICANDTTGKTAAIKMTKQNATEAFEELEHDGKTLWLEPIVRYWCVEVIVNLREPILFSFCEKSSLMLDSRYRPRRCMRNSAKSNDTSCQNVEMGRGALALSLERERETEKERERIKERKMINSSKFVSVITFLLQ